MSDGEYSEEDYEYEYEYTDEEDDGPAEDVSMDASQEDSVSDRPTDAPWQRNAKDKTYTPRIYLDRENALGNVLGANVMMGHDILFDMDEARIGFSEKSGLLVYGLDFPGHGASPGKRGLLTGVDDLIEDGIAVAIHAMADSSKNSKSKNGDLPLFLVGSSMGGAIALAVANRVSVVKGVVMLAPMLSLNVGSAAKTALGVLSTIFPTVPLIPSSATSPAQQYRDADRRAECQRNTLTYKVYLRPQSALTCVEFTTQIQQSFSKVKVPFLCMIAEEDVVVDNSKALELVKESPSKDKTLKSYAALHGLLCEPAPLLGIIEDDFVQWLMERCS